MTEAEWLTCTDPDPMLIFLHRKKSRRKQRLFACACCRLVWGELSIAWRRALEVNEAFADDRVSKEELAKARAFALGKEGCRGDALQAAAFACDTVHSSHLYTRCAARNAARGSEQVRLDEAVLVRDIFNPFGKRKKPPPGWLGWNDGTIPRLAHSIYDDRAFDRLPILADALEEAGCHDADILDHCRRQGAVHVRGCWVVDLVTGRS